MIKKINTGGPAFPVAGSGGIDSTGLTIRDYFAAKALQGLLANPKLQKEILNQGGCVGGWLESSSFAFADAMLEARK